MPLLAVSSMKGGVGKSIWSCAISAALGKAHLLDLVPLQRDAYDWATPNGTPATMVGEHDARLLETAAKAPAWSVADCPPDEIPIHRSALVAAAVVVVPVFPYGIQDTWGWGTAIGIGNGPRLFTELRLLISICNRDYPAYRRRLLLPDSSCRIAEHLVGAPAGDPADRSSAGRRHGPGRAGGGDPRPAAGHLCHQPRVRHASRRRRTCARGPAQPRPGTRILRPDEHVQRPFGVRDWAADLDSLRSQRREANGPAVDRRPKAVDHPLPTFDLAEQEHRRGLPRRPADPHRAIHQFYTIRKGV